MSQHDNPIFRALETSDLKQFRGAIQRWPGFFDIPDQNGRTILSHVCSRGWNDFADEILRRDIGRAMIMIPDCHGSLPIHYAVERGRSSLVNLLLQRGSKSGSQDQLPIANEWGRTPLWYALHLQLEYGVSKDEKKKIVSLLVLAEPSVVTTYMREHASTGEIVLETMISFLHMIYTDPIYASTQPNSIFALALNAVGTDWIRTEEIPRWIAAAAENLDLPLLERLLNLPAAAGVSINALRWTHVAIEKNHLELFNYTLIRISPEQKFSLLPYVPNWMLIIIHRGHVDMVEAILKMISSMDVILPFELEVEISKWIDATVQSGNVPILDRILAFAKYEERPTLKESLAESIPVWILRSIQHRDPNLVERILNLGVLIDYPMENYVPSWIRTAIEAKDAFTLDLILNLDCVDRCELPFDISRWVVTAIQNREVMVLEQILNLGATLNFPFEPEIPTWISIAIDSRDLRSLDRILDLALNSKCDLSFYIPRWAARAIRHGNMPVLERILPVHTSIPLMDERGSSLFELIPNRDEIMLEYLLRTQTWPLTTVATVLLQEHEDYDEDYSSDDEEENVSSRSSRFTVLAERQKLSLFRICLEQARIILESEDVPIELREQLHQEIVGIALNRDNLLLRSYSCHRILPVKKYRRRFLYLSSVIVQHGGASALWTILKRDAHQLISGSLRDRQFGHALFLLWLGCEIEYLIPSFLPMVLVEYPEWDEGYNNIDRLMGAVEPAPRPEPRPDPEFEQMLQFGRNPRWNPNHELWMGEHQAQVPVQREIDPVHAIRNRVIIIRALDLNATIIPARNDHGDIRQCLIQRITEEQRLAIRHSVYFYRSLTERLLYFI